MELFIPRRPLKPPRKERKKIKAQNLNTNVANIVVRVIRAFNVPIRDEGTILASNRGRTLTPATVGGDHEYLHVHGETETLKEETSLDKVYRIG